MPEVLASEMMAAAGARELHDGEVVVVGLGLPQVACVLAKRTHAPGLSALLRIGQAYCSIDGAHIHHSDLQKSAQPRSVRPLGKHASHLRQSKSNDDNFAVTELSGPRSGHHLR